MIDVGFGIIQIDLGMVLLLISLIAFILDIFFVIRGDSIDKWEIYSELSLTVGSSALIISFIYFAYSAISADYSFTYVSSYVNNGMDFFMRLSAVWSGPEGSYFFWAFLAIILYLIFRNLFRDYAHVSFFWRSFVLMAVQIVFLIVLTTVSDPFKLNEVIQVDGIGLDPVLMSVWNFIHPPIIFIGYVLCLIPMVIGFVRISMLVEGKVPNFDGKEMIDNFFEFVVSLAWLVLSSGIIIGGYWAYITLGWGGFWAWDPVETASLIPWLFLTLYYHGKYFHRKNEFLGNYIISMGYIGVLFATYLTRSGIVTSVHSYRPEATIENILSVIIPKNSFLMAIILRFIPNEKILVLFIILVMFFLLLHILGIKKGQIKRFPFIFQKTDFSADKSRTTALKISYLAFFIGTYVMILGLVFPVIFDILGYLVTLSPTKTGFWFTWFGTSLSIDKLFYNTILTFFGGIMLLAQFFCTFYPRFSIKRKFGLIIVGIILGIIFSISGFLYRNGFLTSSLGSGNPILSFFSNFWTSSDKANFVMPLIILGVMGLIIEFVNIALKEEKHLIRKTSQVMLHLSFLIIILGAILSANMTNSQSLEFLQQGSTYDIPGTSIKIQILDLDRRYPSSGQHSAEFETSFVLSAGNRPIGFGITQLAYDRVNRPDIIVTIISDIFADIYIVTSGVYTERISGNFVAIDLQIKIIPYINILWAGCVILHFAIIPLTIGRFVLLRNVLSLSNSLEKNENVELDKNIAKVKE
ncbi:MAG: cytochrome c biogenesis protein CcsA [Candidatus Hodarchaeota archaeon]